MARTVGYGIGLDIEAGLGFPLGFAYDVHFYPAGLGVILGHTGYLGLFAGIGTSGVTSHIPAAFELRSSYGSKSMRARWARLGFRIASITIPGHDDRHGRAVLPFADESVLGAFARFGATDFAQRAAAGHWILPRLRAREVMHTHWLSLVIGSEIDFGM